MRSEVKYTKISSQIKFLLQVYLKEKTIRRFLLVAYMIKDLFQNIIDDLSVKGWFSGCGLFPLELCQSLYNEAQRFAESENQFRKAKVGDKDNAALHQEIRNDQIKWITEENATVIQKQYLALVYDLMIHFKQSFFMPLNTFECHFAMYEEGGYYKKHFDSFKNKNARLFTIVLYLNPNWSETDGGSLVIYNQENEDLIDAIVHPKIGNFTIFLSENIQHEVLSCRNERFSLTGWLRYN